MRSRRLFEFVVSILVILIGMSMHSKYYIESNNTLEKQDFSSNTPIPSLDLLTLANEFISFQIRPRGLLLGENSFKYDNYDHNYQWIPYISINDGTVLSFADLTIVEPLQLISDFNGYQVAKVVLLHPNYQIYINILFELFPGDKFFKTVFYINSTAQNNFKTELFLYNDADVGGDFVDDIAQYYSSDDILNVIDPDTGYQINLASSIMTSVRDCRYAESLYSDIQKDRLLNKVYVGPGDIAIGSKYVNSSTYQNQIWAVPILYGSETDRGIYNTQKNLLAGDFSVLNFNISTEGIPSVSARILNGGTKYEQRMIQVFRNGTEIANQNLFLKPSEHQDIQFNNLNFTPGCYNDIQVAVTTGLNDEPRNNQISQIIYFEKSLTLQFLDANQNPISNANISLIRQSNSELIQSHLTDSMGFVVFDSLLSDIYEIRAYSTWTFTESLFFETSISYPNSGYQVQLLTNLTQSTLHFEDIVGNPVPNIYVEISDEMSSELIHRGYSNSIGDISLYWLNHTYNFTYVFSNYGKIGVSGEYSGWNVNVNPTLHIPLQLTRFYFHLNTSHTGDNIIGAKVLFNAYINPDYFGPEIGYEITNATGNMSFFWKSDINYTIRVEFFSEIKAIQGSPHSGDPIYYSMNLTHSIWNFYYYATIEVLITDITEYRTEMSLLTNLPLIYTWGNNLSIKVSYFIVNNGYFHLDTSTVEIRNLQNIVVFSGFLSPIFDEIGNHTLEVNTSLFFLGGSPAVYNIFVYGQKIGYTPPNPLQFSFSLFNIETELILNSTSKSLYWGDSFEILAYFNDSINNCPILDANLTLDWEDYLESFEMINHQNGTYSILINTTISRSGTYNLFINANRLNFDSKTKKFSLNVNNVPTSVNNTIFFDSYHPFFVGESKEYLYYFTDQVRNVTIPNLELNYQFSNTLTQEIRSGHLKYQDDYYVFDPRSEFLPIGLYSGLIEFKADNYQTCYATFRFEIFPIPLSINSSSILQGIPYEVYQSEIFQMDFLLKRTTDDGPVIDAEVTYSIKIHQSLELFSEDSLINIGDGRYRFIFNSCEFPLDLFVVNLTFTKSNHTLINLQFSIKSNLRPLLCNLTDIQTSIPYELYSGEYFLRDFLLQDGRNSQLVSLTNGSIFILNSLSEYSFSSLIKIDQGIYRFFFNSSQFPIGTFIINITFVKTNYTMLHLQFSIKSNLRPLISNITDIQTSIPYELYLGEILQRDFLIQDGLNSQLVSLTTGSVFITNIKMDSISSTLIKIDEGLYRFIFNSSHFPIGSYIINITFFKMNYTSIFLQFSIRSNLRPLIGNLTDIQTSIPYELYIGESFHRDFLLLDGLNNQSVSLTNSSSSISNAKAELYNFDLNPLGNGFYRFTFNTLDFPIGSYIINITFMKMNYTILHIQFSIKSNLRPLLCNLTEFQTSIPYELYIGETFQRDFLVLDGINFQSLLFANATFTIFTKNMVFIDTGLIVPCEDDQSLFLFMFESSRYNLGSYIIQISFAPINYSAQAISFAINILSIPIYYNSVLITDESESIQITSQFTIIRQNPGRIIFSLRDVWGNPISGANFSYSITDSEDNIFSGTLESIGNGQYSLTLNGFEDVGLHILHIQIEKGNFTTISTDIYIQVEWPTILGLPTPYWAIIGLVIGLVIGFVSTFQTIKYAKTPLFIKQLDQISNTIRKNKSLKRVPVGPKDVYLSKKYSNRWKIYQIEDPFKPIASEIAQFIELYQEAKGKFLFEEDASNYLEKLSIFNETERRLRLIEDKIPMNMIDHVLELVDGYIHSLEKESVV